MTIREIVPVEARAVANNGADTVFATNLDTSAWDSVIVAAGPFGGTFLGGANPPFPVLELRWHDTKQTLVTRQYVVDPANPPAPGYTFRAPVLGPLVDITLRYSPASLFTFGISVADFSVPESMTGIYERIERADTVGAGGGTINVGPTPAGWGNLRFLGFMQGALRMAIAITDARTGAAIFPGLGVVGDLKFQVEASATSTTFVQIDRTLYMPPNGVLTIGLANTHATVNEQAFYGVEVVPTI